jgi:hypothetical protein
MNTSRSSVIGCVLVAALGLVAGCGGDGAPKPDSGHTGWQQPNCLQSGCHDQGHNGATMPYECADCHGDNGAPEGHGAGCGTDLTCHGGQDHGGAAAGFPPPEACEACHGT